MLLFPLCNEKRQETRRVSTLLGPGGVSSEGTPEAKC